MKLDKVLIAEEEIAEIVESLSDKINSDFEGEEVLLVVVLKGSLVFAADLMRKLDVPVYIDFMRVSSYGMGTVSSGELNIKLDLSTDIENKNVIIVEDIIDTGNTLYSLKQLLLSRKPKQLKICTLLDKPERRTAEVEADYTGKTIPDEFVVGYGLDCAERYRELPFVGVLK